MAIITTGSMPKALTGKTKVKPMKPMSGKKGPKIGCKEMKTEATVLNKLIKGK